MKERYFGSVRFFKNMILLAVLVGIAVPASLAVRHSGQATALAEQTRALERQLEQLTAQTDTLLEQAQALQATAEAEGPPPAEVPAYQSLYPDFYSEGTGAAEDPDGKTIYLTFDDGPTAHTAELLSVLARQQVPATFFVTGTTDAASLQQMREIVEQGHAIGLHSYSHRYRAIYSSVESFLEDQYQLFTLIRDTTGVTPSVFRMPGGSINAYDYGIYQDILAEMMRRGFVPFDWNISSGDSAGGSPAQTIVSRVTAAATDLERGVVLFHDSSAKNSTAAALSPIIDQLRAQGFSFASLSGAVRPLVFGRVN